MSGTLISCPRCTKRLEVAPEFLGRWIDCPHCEMEFAAVAAEAGEAGHQATFDIPSQRRPRWILRGWLLTGFIACSAAILIILEIIHGDDDHGTKNTSAPSPIARAPSLDPEKMPALPIPWPAEETEEPEPGPAVLPEMPEAKTPVPAAPNLAPARPTDRPSIPLAPKPVVVPPVEPALPSKDGKQSSADPNATAVLRALNAFRKAATLKSARLDADLSEGCQAHARYLVRNFRHPSTNGLGMHKENPALDGYTEKGALAGARSVIDNELGQRRPLWQARSVDIWMASLYHRLPLLHPELENIGVGFAESIEYHYRVAALDAQSGVNRRRGNRPPKVEAVIFPTDDQRNVPCLFSLGSTEVPNPIPGDGDSRSAGYPITATFYERAQVKDVEAAVTGKEGKEMPAWISTPSQPASRAAPQPGTICLIPKRPLRPVTRYTVSISATVNSSPWQRSWSFTTGAN